MSSSTADAGPARTANSARERSPLFSAVIGLAALAVLLQGVWAGIFLEHDGARDAAGSWIEVHSWGADVAIALGVIATVVAVIKVRNRRELWTGSAVFTVLLVLEAYLGGLIRDDGQDILTAVHIPLAMVLLGLAVWLPFRAARRT